MSDAAVVSRPGAFAQIVVQEPAGERTLSSPLTIGGESANVVVPGTGPDPVLRIDRREGVWIAQTLGSETVRFDGRPLKEQRDLRRGDVLAVGDAQIIVADASRTLLRLDVCHLVGNATVAPVGVVSALGLEADESAEDLEIHAIGAAPVIPATPATVELTRPAAVLASSASGAHRTRWIIGGIALLVLAGLLILAASFVPVIVDALPADARVRTVDTLLSLRSGESILMLPGNHRVRAEAEGYEPSEVDVFAREDGASSVRFRLAKLPGKLNIDTRGVPATVSVDGIEVGRAPGEVSAPAGPRTITLRAPRYLDYVTTLDVMGMGELQQLEVQFSPSWGTLKISAVPANVEVIVDGRAAGNAPAALEVDAGVRRVQLTAPGLKTWESTVVVKAGETINVGPITLGLPDAKLTVQSAPAGAEVTVGGTFRGRAPVSVDLPSGIAHDVVVSLPGHENFTRSVFAEPGKSLALEVKLSPILANVAIQGEPTDAEVFIDGVSSGKTPRVLKLTTIEHRLEVRKPGFITFASNVLPAKGLERVVQYRLTSSDRATALQESAPTITTKSGITLRFIPPGKFKMGSDRREQGRRPNESLREVTLQRPFYLGVTEVTNLTFRRFRAGHTSGFIEKQSFDLDGQPVTRVSWEDAAAFCNWLSEQEGLPPAYEARGTTYALKKPVNNGYRLPTEAEWEYAARYAGPGRMQRFAWGDALPIAPQVGNLAGEEAAKVSPTVMQGYKDNYNGLAPVGKFGANALGLQDMSGNVSEWMNDYYLSFVDNSAGTDPLGPATSSRHVVRGANWQSAAVAELRLAWRDGASEPLQTIGFRVARYAE